MSVPSHFLCRVNSINNHGKESCSLEQSSPRLCDFSHKNVGDSTLKSWGQIWVLASGRIDDLYVVCAQDCVGNSFEGPVCVKRGKAHERVSVASSIFGSEDNINCDLHFFSSWEDLVDEMSFFSPYFSHICLHVLSIKMKYCQIWNYLGFFSAVFSTVNTNNKLLLL